ncbi:MAG: phosphomannose isomerase type II C-terminal cupin domain [Gammaproteobacteria bacterium]
MSKNHNKIGEIYERPWGSYQTLALEDGYQVKSITVNPGGRLSLQKHQHRSEHWLIVRGAPTITVGSSTSVYRAGEKIFIDKGELHRAENFTKEPAVIIEVQLGSYLGEDDIERLEDVYGR